VFAAAIAIALPPPLALGADWFTWVHCALVLLVIVAVWPSSIIRGVTDSHSEHYSVAVRALCEFAAKQGDLDLRFTPSPTSSEGMAGHATVTARRGAGYQKEVALSGDFGLLRVRGRADGYDPRQQRLEEIKTFRGDLARQPANHRVLHWAQAKVYGWLMCRQLGLAQIDVALVYLDVATQRETVLVEHCAAADLKTFFDALCGRFLAWAEQELAHRAQRDAVLRGLRFPHPSFRPGQRELAAAVFNAARRGCCLLAQAPTGIGKSVGTLFPLLKACPTQALDKLFFLTAKGSGKALAFDALALIQRSEPGLRLRVLELVARDTACEHPDKACHGDACPLARGFYDRLPAARAAAVAQGGGPLTRDALREVALAHQVCPYYLGQEMARWSDVLVGDYNHFFDDSALLHALTTANQWRVGVLVDEAHNLVERARGMYSAELRHADLKALCASAPAALKRPLQKLHRAWQDAVASQDEAYRVYDTPPSKLAVALRELSAALTEHLAEQPVGLDGAWLGFYFDLLQFCRLIDVFGSHSLFDVTLDTAARSSTLCLRNVVPAPFLQPRFAAAQASVLFSATLTPPHYYADTLGLPDDHACIDVAAPFAAEQLSVRIVRHVSTRWRHRTASLAPIAQLIAEQYRAQPGNYLAFFSSFDYLAQAAEVFAACHPEIPMWLQGRRMDEAERGRFLARFDEQGQGIAFAVLGGSFGEGIDLPGKRLVGAFIATLGLPQFNPVNEEFRRRIEQIFGAGYDYAYLFPGIRKVVQAAGRVIRTPTDQGVVHLIDDRFARPEVLRLLPAWWAISPPAGLSARPELPVQSD
jgi:Rad3-related DNA helicase